MFQIAMVSFFLAFYLELIASNRSDRIKFPTKAAEDSIGVFFFWGRNARRLWKNEK